MARIRSVHPGFFTDERFVATSMAARLLFIGIGIEADDKGVFEWKPITLKMRLFPVDNVDIAVLLEELIEAGVIASYEIKARKYGAIRNFTRHQRPKTPNDIHPLPDELFQYVGLTASAPISPKRGNAPRSTRPISPTKPAKPAKPAQFAPIFDAQAAQAAQAGQFELISEMKPAQPPSISEMKPAQPDPFPQKGECGAQMEDGEEKEDSSLRSESPAAKASGVDQTAVAAYSTLARHIGLPDIKLVSKTRKRKLHAILAEHGIDAWNQALAKLEASAFCRGSNDRGWIANFDFLVQPSSFLKLLEGQFDNRPVRPNGPAPPAPRPADDDGSAFRDLLRRKAQGE